MLNEIKIWYFSLIDINVYNRNSRNFALNISVALDKGLEDDIELTLCQNIEVSFIIGRLTAHLHIKYSLFGGFEYSSSSCESF